MLWVDLEERTINLENMRQVEQVRIFMEKFELTFDNSIDYTMAIYKNDQLVATGSLNGEVMRNIAIDESLQGEGLTAAVISHLMREAARRGIFHYFLFTKVDKAHLFAALGFNELARFEPHAVLLESGFGSIASYCRELSCSVSQLPSGTRAGLVVNCNPFTLGHKAVIAKAAAENDGVVVMVVSEDRSLFPFAVRLELVRQGLAEFSNVVVIPGGKYVISSATFPGYFTRGQDTVITQAYLDATVFAKFIAQALGITKRYVGEEPYCPVTNAYNGVLLDVLPKYNIALEIMPRMKIGEDIVSASMVRAFIRTDNWDELQQLLPVTTYEYLISDAAKPIIDKIKQTPGRH